MGFLESGSSRRRFLKTAAIGSAALSLSPLRGVGRAEPAPASAKGAGFKLKYAPGIGMFEASAGKAAVDQLKIGRAHV